MRLSRNELLSAGLRPKPAPQSADKAGPCKLCNNDTVSIGIGQWCTHPTCLQGRYTVYAPCCNCKRQEFLDWTGKAQVDMGICAYADFLKILHAMTLRTS